MGSIASAFCSFQDVHPSNSYFYYNYNKGSPKSSHDLYPQVQNPTRCKESSKPNEDLTSTGALRCLATAEESGGSLTGSSWGRDFRREQLSVCQALHSAVASEVVRKLNLRISSLESLQTFLISFVIRDF